MEVSSAVKEGWEFFAKYGSATMGAVDGANYVGRVEDAIQALNDDINAFATNSLPQDKLKGLIAEAWHAGTFNINAGLCDSASKGYREASQEHASVDVTVVTSDGSKLPFSMKYYASGKGAKGSAAMQAKNVIQAYHEYRSKPRSGQPMTFDEYLKKYGYSKETSELLKSVYNGQGRIIPTDQLDEAKSYLAKKMNEELGKEGPNRAAVYQNYKETLDKLDDRIKDGNGVESIPLTKEESEVIAALSREQDFDASNFGISLELITRDYIMNHALKAGYTAAVITLVLQIAPEIFKALDYLIKKGEINVEQLKRTGWKSLSASATGFIRGSVSCGLTIACQAGKLGNAFMGADSMVIGAATVLVMDAMKYSYGVARGEMAPREMGYALSKEIMVSVAAISGGLALQPVIPVVGYLLGSFLGSVAASTMFEVGEKVFLSFCTGTGFACFGLVNQNYELPPNVMDYIGLDIINLKQKDIAQCEVPRVEIQQANIDRVTYDTIEIMVLRRGIVGVNKIAYVQ